MEKQRKHVDVMAERSYRRADGEERIVCKQWR
jgi:hypothetical protein